MSYLLGTKLGMTRVFDEAGRSIAVTAVKVDPCVVTQCRTLEKDGYTAIQVGTGVKKHPNKPEAGHAKGLAATPQTICEFRIENIDDYKVGQVIDTSSLTIGDKLRVIGTSKGKGFAGVIKRHNFHRGPETHGSDHHRRPGSNGSMYPQHVLKGKKQPGHLGNERTTLRNVRVVDVLSNEHIVLVSGPVPGIRGAIVQLSPM